MLNRLTPQDPSINESDALPVVPSEPTPPKKSWREILSKSYQTYRASSKKHPEARSVGRSAGACIVGGLTFAMMALCPPSFFLLAGGWMCAILFAGGAGLGGLIGGPLGVGIAELVESISSPKTEIPPSQSTAATTQKNAGPGKPVSTVVIHSRHGLNQEPNPRAYASSSPQAAPAAGDGSRKGADTGVPSKKYTPTPSAAFSYDNPYAPHNIGMMP